MDNEIKTKFDKTIVIPVEKKMWQSLRKISYEQEMSMSELTREAIKKVIKKYGKDVDL